MSFRQDTDKGPWPRYVFEHHQGWDVIKSGPRRYRLSWEGRFGYLAGISREIGDRDIPGRGTWLRWFIYENQCGRRAFEAKADAWKELRPIRTARDLARLIEADLPRAT